MIEGPKFNSHDQQKKIKYMYLCNQVEAASKIRYAVTTLCIHILLYKNLNFLWKKSGDEAEVVQCHLSLLSIASFISNGPLIGIN